MIAPSATPGPRQLAAAPQLAVSAPPARPARRAWPRFLAPIAVMAVIWIASSTPAVHGRGPGLLPPWLQNLLHVPVFGVLCGAWLWALTGIGVDWRRGVVVAALAAALYGVIDEAHQAFVPGRTASFTDLLLDALGALLAIAIVARYRRRPPA